MGYVDVLVYVYFRGAPRGVVVEMTSDIYCDFYYYPSYRLAHILRRTVGVVILSAAPNSG